MNEKTPSVRSQEINEVSINDIFLFFKRYWLLLMLVGVLFGGIGFGVSYLIPEEYEASAKILPEFGAESGAGGLSNLASLAGISLGSKMSDALRPTIYPSILSSKPFLIKLLSTPFTLKDGKKILLVTYLNEKASPITAQQIAQADSLITLSRDQEKAMKDLANRITTTADRMNGILSLQVQMPDPTLAAVCTKFSLNYLTDFVTEYRDGKKYEKVAFLRKQMAEAKNKYQRAEIALNSYRDRNRNTFNNMARVTEQRLQSDYMQSQSLYGELSQQLEAARLQALEETPVMKVLEPPMVANWKSKPKRSMYALGMAFLGIIGAIFSIMIKKIVFT